MGHRSERSEKLFGGVAKELVRRTWQFKPQDVGTTLWSFATAEYFDHDAFRAGASRLNFRQIRSFKVRIMLWYLEKHWQYKRLSARHYVFKSNLIFLIMIPDL